jgi:hypothetical protein
VCLEGSFTVNQLAVELEKLQPEKNHNWDIQTTGIGAFLINFPSADLLDTVVNWGPMDAKFIQGKISFEKGTNNEVYRREIDKVWVQFRGLPSEFKEFPIIWAQIRFWVDTWLGNKPLKDKFPALFNIIRRKQDSIATVMSSPLLNISFRRNLVGANLLNWN